NKRLRYYGIDKDEHVFHGYRTTFSTLARDKLRLEGELIEIQLDHNVKSKVQAAYDRSERLEERYEMMVKWGDYVDSLRFIK
ncbi:MAG: integrase, partial [Hydrogenovibrio crunogenus]|nr:integrase [Hydrogenovibrio crunogenus]